MATGRIPRGRTARGWGTFTIVEAAVEQGSYGPQLALTLEGEGKVRDWLSPDHVPYLAEAIWGKEHEHAPMGKIAGWLVGGETTVDADIQDGKEDGDGGHYPSVAEYARAGSRTKKEQAAPAPDPTPAPAVAAPAPAPAVAAPVAKPAPAPAPAPVAAPVASAPPAKEYAPPVATATGVPSTAPVPAGHGGPPAPPPQGI